MCLYSKLKCNTSPPNFFPSSVEAHLWHQHEHLPVCRRLVILTSHDNLGLNLGVVLHFESSKKATGNLQVTQKMYVSALRA